MTAVTQSTDHVPAGGDAHLVRVCLDLQLDAMLFAVGASAARPATGRATESRPLEATWHRWMLEDLQMVCALAADVLRGGAALPPTFGSEPRPDATETAVEHLTARYAMMADLLTGVIDAAGTEAAPVAAGTDTARAARTALDRCRNRLAELTGTRTQPGSTPTPVTPRRPGDRPFLPGELLG